MISLTRLNHTQIFVNSDLIEHIETTPDTVIALTTGQRLVARETAEEVVARIVQFRRRISCADQGNLTPPEAGGPAEEGRCGR